jgi:hypothetical protein
MKKKAMSGITVNDQPLEAVLDLVENGQPDEFTKEECSKPKFYHSPRLKYIDKGERPGPVMTNNIEMHKRGMDAKVKSAIKRNHLDEALIAVLLGSKEPLTCVDITKYMNTQAASISMEEINDYSLRTYLGLLKRPPLSKHVIFGSKKVPGSHSKRTSYQLKKEFRFNNTFEETCQLFEQREVKHRKDTSKPTANPAPDKIDKEVRELLDKSKISIERDIPKDININLGGTFRFEFVFKIEKG